MQEVKGYFKASSARTATRSPVGSGGSGESETWRLARQLTRSLEDRDGKTGVWFGDVALN